MIVASGVSPSDPYHIPSLPHGFPPPSTPFSDLKWSIILLCQSNLTSGSLRPLHIIAGLGLRSGHSFTPAMLLHVATAASVSPRCAQSVNVNPPPLECPVL